VPLQYPRSFYLRLPYYYILGRSANFGFISLFEKESILVRKEGTFCKGYLGGVGELPKASPKALLAGLVICMSILFNFTLQQSKSLCYWRPKYFVLRTRPHIHLIDLLDVGFNGGGV
jgi:hypothetical protein